MPYADGTKVPVESSRGEISGLLTKHGVMEMGWMSKPTGDAVTFVLNGRTYVLRIVRPTTEDIFRLFPNHQDTDAKIAAEWRRRWRAIVLLVKAKLEFAASSDGASSVETEFLPYLLMDGGQTLAEWVASDGQKLLGPGK